MPAKNTQQSTALLRAQLRVMLGNEIAFGPGKADLLEAIRDTGSISAAGKKMGMSYRRAWLLVDAMNRCFQQPLVDTAKGGTNGGGTQLTKLGAQILEDYRALQAEVAIITNKHFEKMQSCLRKMPLASESAT
ncbi:LysR family transcriptional regulator [Cellvibrio zantedeschiae]|uniref:LysR family transcriptional regulator n=1 Tax=Cellvibrio zantedeschiae TaxID=1237077 RepID=A0ABQ3ASL8_9GAMM|nr:winged helix-turn-helix domain-containing protein [Cellvibrio zantedeschiae]GGY62684.1 LysR family transcriptional regulator [Cellvibrio zantedeschiae]